MHFCCALVTFADVSSFLPAPPPSSPHSKTWSQLIADWDSNVKKKSKYIRELAWKGIPNPMRSLVWPLLAGVNMAYSPLKEMYPKLLAVSRSVCGMCVRSPVVCELSLA